MEESLKSLSANNEVDKEYYADTFKTVLSDFASFKTIAEKIEAKKVYVNARKHYLKMYSYFRFMMNMIVNQTKEITELKNQNKQYQMLLDKAYYQLDNLGVGDVGNRQGSADRKPFSSN